LGQLLETDTVFASSRILGWFEWSLAIQLLLGGAKGPYSAAVVGGLDDALLFLFGLLIKFLRSVWPFDAGCNCLFIEPSSRGN
ncbi:hypothetical protein U1Q18_025359, partial [Sarracenia purpurea var. burkii]